MSNIIAIHQPNFIPWMPYFEKMALCDTFVVLVHCQFEKSGFTNRCMVNERWWTNPIRQGTDNILNKRYANGAPLTTTNLHLIIGIAAILGIDTKKIVTDFDTKANASDRILEICQFYKGTVYLANHKSGDKYLDVGMLKHAGIEFIPFEGKLKKHPFEMFAESGIERTKELFWRAVNKQKEAWIEREVSKEVSETCPAVG